MKPGHHDNTYTRNLSLPHNYAGKFQTMTKLFLFLQMKNLVWSPCLVEMAKRGVESRERKWPPRGTRKFVNRLESVELNGWYIYRIIKYSIKCANSI